MPKNVKASQRTEEGLPRFYFCEYTLRLSSSYIRSKARRSIFSCEPAPSAAAKLFNSDFFIMDQHNNADDKCSPSYTETHSLLNHEGIVPERQNASPNRWPLILLGLNCVALLIHTILLVLGHSNQKCFSHASKVLSPSHGQSAPVGSARRPAKISQST